MKNIHVLPTESFNPLGLQIWRRKNGGLFRPTKANPIANNLNGKVNIYITSDEKIKEGDWFYCPITDTVNHCESDYHSKILIKPKRFKIILTTDQDLIKDGIQTIDDDFLEWFIKNPSCEWVEVVDDIKYFNIDELRERHRKGLPHLYSEKIAYKLIIPKEELSTKLHIGEVVDESYPEEFTKQETLEEVAEKATNIESLTWENKYAYNKFLEGAKWQQEQNKNLYSEEEVRSIANWAFGFYRRNNLSDDELESEFNKILVEQFKKK